MLILSYCKALLHKTACLFRYFYLVGKLCNKQDTAMPWPRQTLTQASLISSTNDTPQKVPRSWTQDISWSHQKYNGKFGSEGGTKLAFQYFLPPKRTTEHHVSSCNASVSHYPGSHFEPRSGHRILWLKLFAICFTSYRQTSAWRLSHWHFRSYHSTNGPMHSELSMRLYTHYYL